VPSPPARAAAAALSPAAVASRPVPRAAAAAPSPAAVASRPVARDREAVPVTRLSGALPSRKRGRAGKREKEQRSLRGQVVRELSD
jgi:hypothetical protein